MDRLPARHGARGFGGCGWRGADPRRHLDNGGRSKDEARGSNGQDRAHGEVLTGAAIAKTSLRSCGSRGRGEASRMPQPVREIEVEVMPKGSSARRVPGRSGDPLVELIARLMDTLFVI